MSSDRFQLPDVRFVKRIVVGSDNPQALKSEEDIQAAADLLNRCLNDLPKGRIIAPAPCPSTARPGPFCCSP